MLNVNDVINLYNTNYRVEQTDDSYFLQNISGGVNNSIFYKLDINKKDLSIKVLGYCRDGDFPECNTLEDLNKLVNALKKEIIKKDKWCVKVTKENANILGEFYARHSFEGYKKIIPNKWIGKYATSHNVSSGDSIFSKNNGSNFDLEKPNKTFPEISFEEFINRYLKNKEMKTYKISAKEAKEIFGSINQSCSWKKRLAELWGTDIMLNNDITITEELLQEGLGDATSTQKKLINKYVLKETSYSWKDLEYGQAVLTSNNEIMAKTYDGWVDLNNMVDTYNASSSIFTGKLVTLKISVD